jgi:hypothetical protein
MDALRPRLRAIGEDVTQVGKLYIAIFLDQPGDVVAAAPAAGLALDRQGRGAEVGEGEVIALLRGTLMKDEVQGDQEGGPAWRGRRRR